MNSPITLSSARLTAGVCPDVGGALVWFGLRDDAGIDFVRPTPMRAAAENNARMASSYPLVPYSNRIGDGRFEFDGSRVVLRRNAEFSEHSIHGIGFQRAWTMVASAGARLEIAIEHDGVNGTDPDWPWSFSATQVFTIDDNGLAVRIDVTNRDPRPMPAGIGLHPFFPKMPATEVRFEADAVWLGNARMLPESRIDVPRRFDFAERRAVADLDVDHCFAGWNGSAEIVWPDKKWGLTIEATDAFGHLIVYTSPSRDSIAIEPVSHVNNAVNLAHERNDTGLRTLVTGQTLSGTMTLSPFALQV